MDVTYFGKTKQEKKKVFNFKKKSTTNSFCIQKPGDILKVS